MGWLIFDFFFTSFWQFNLTVMTIIYFSALATLRYVFKALNDNQDIKAIFS